MSESKHTSGPWEYVSSTEHHGAYVASSYGDICDCYTMSSPLAASVRNGGDSYPIPFQGEAADANARLIAAAPELLEALRAAEELHQVGMLNATVELVDRVVTLRRAAIAKATGAA